MDLALLRRVFVAQNGHRPQLDSLTADAIKQRLTARLSLTEMAGLTLAFTALAWFATNDLGWTPACDYHNLYLAGSGVMLRNMYYVYWIMPLLQGLAQLPYPVAYAIWGVLNITGFAFAVRVFGGRPGLAYFSFQLLALVFAGQISGILTGGLALFWYGITRRDWRMAGIGLTVILTKYQFGLLGLAAIVLSVRLTRREWATIALTPALAGLTSLILYPQWPADLIVRFATNPPITDFSVSLWRWFGAWGALALLPILWVPRRVDAQLIGWYAVGALGLPYFQQIDLLVLMALPVGPAAAIGLINFAQVALGVNVVAITWLIPTTILGALALREVRAATLTAGRASRQTASGGTRSSG